MHPKHRSLCRGKPRSEASEAHRFTLRAAAPSATSQPMGGISYGVGGKSLVVVLGLPRSEDQNGPSLELETQ